jgi:membrane protease YdiL (CAAX protease family)
VIGTSFVIGWIDSMPHGWSTLPIAIGLVVFVAAYLGFGPPAQLKARARRPVPEANIGGYSTKDVQNFVNSIGKSAYRSQLIWDMVFALLYGAGLVVVVDGTFGWALKPSGRLVLLAFIPLAVVVADLLEDALLLGVIHSSGNKNWEAPGRLTKFASWVTRTKFALTAASILLIVAGGVALGIKGSRWWPADDFTPLVLASLGLIVSHLALTLTVPPRPKAQEQNEEPAPKGPSLWWEVLSAGFRLALGLLVLFLGAEWFFDFTGPQIGSFSEIAAKIGLDFSGGWPLRLGLWGGSFAGGIVVAFVIAYFFVPVARVKALDPRFKDMSLGQLGFKVVLILSGTVLFEELLFRGVLFQAWAFGRPDTFAIVGSSIVFGLWHIGPALRDEERRRPRTGLAPGDESGKRDLVRDRRTSTVIRTVIAMVAAGVGFSLLRIWSGGLWAPALVHFTANGGGVMFSWLAARRTRRDGTDAERPLAAAPTGV